MGPAEVYGIIATERMQLRQEQAAHHRARAELRRAAARTTPRRSWRGAIGGRLIALGTRLEAAG